MGHRLLKLLIFRWKKEYITAFLFVIHFLDADDYINTNSLLSILFFGHFIGLLFSLFSLAHTTLQSEPVLL